LLQAAAFASQRFLSAGALSSSVKPDQAKVEHAGCPLASIFGLRNRRFSSACLAG